MTGYKDYVNQEFLTLSEEWQILVLCSGYLQKEAAVIPIILPFVYHGFAHFTVHLRISSFFRWGFFKWTAKWANPRLKVAQFISLDSQSIRKKTRNSDSLTSEFHSRCKNLGCRRKKRNQINSIEDFLFSTFLLHFSFQLT